jgi:anti-sigma B factor antagonist
VPESGGEYAELARVQVEHGPDLVRAMVVGELDMSNADLVFEQLTAAASADHDLIVDLTGLAFIDSAGIAALDRLSRTVAGSHTRLRIVAPAGSVAGRTLALAGMDQVLPMATSEAAD